MKPTMTMKSILIFLLGTAFGFQPINASPQVPDQPLRGGSQAPPKRRMGIRQFEMTGEFQTENEATTDQATLANSQDDMNGQSQINEAQVRQAAARLRRSLQNDTPIRAEFVADTKLPTDVGHFRLRAYRILDPTNEFVGTEPCVIYSEDKPPFGEDGQPLEGVPVRVHDQCMTSEVFRSQRCDCKEQLKMALEYVKENGGFIIYLQQEGRGIGIANKVAAYALQDAGYDTVDANTKLGLPEDCRHYGVVPAILADMNVSSIRLMTNNPRKVNRLESLGVSIEGTVPHVVPKPNQYNRRYLETKQTRMSHANFGAMFQTTKHMTPRAERYRKSDVDNNDQ